MTDALVLGIDVSCRVGNAMYPDHQDRGWHITGSTGTLGAAPACARLLGLDTARTAMALGIAASQPVGMREQFGSMTKPFHPGAARDGLMSALLASKGFTASPKAIEAPPGMLQTVSAKCDWREITHELDQRFESGSLNHRSACLHRKAGERFNFAVPVCHIIHHAQGGGEMCRCEFDHAVTLGFCIRKDKMRVLGQPFPGFCTGRAA